ncbi:hypothetical protein G3I28_43615, partial [Streptomyces sp. SID10116]|nr:hypothetical protein [Streptomyces sp. SID10116]
MTLPDRLPTGYTEFVTYPADYRRAVYAALSAPARSDLWVARFAHYRKPHPQLSARQSAVPDDATRGHRGSSLDAGRRRPPRSWTGQSCRRSASAAPARSCG